MNPPNWVPLQINLNLAIITAPDQSQKHPSRALAPMMVEFCEHACAITMTSIDANLLAELRQILGAEGVVSRPTELKVYECDGWTVGKSIPEVMLLPRSTTQLSEVLKALHRRGVAFVPRGAGTGLSGGCLPLNAPAMICTSKMNRILEIDCENRRVEVESGVVNLHVTNAVNSERIFLRARSVVASGVHHRRQYRREFRRSAYAQVRGDD